MTKDDDFKRIVRRRARQSGRAYSAVRAEYEAERSQQDQRWLVVRTFPGAEEQVQQWLHHHLDLGVIGAMVPRFQGRKLMEGLVLLRLGPAAKLEAIPREAWFLGFVGTGMPVDWEGVRSVLRRLPSPRRRAPRSTRLQRMQVGVAEPVESVEAQRAFAAIATAADAAASLGAEADAVTSQKRESLLEQMDKGIRARRHLLNVYDYLVTEMAAELEEGGIPAGADISAVTEAGVSGLAWAINSFPNSAQFAVANLPSVMTHRTSDPFVAFAQGWIRDSMWDYLRSDGSTNERGAVESRSVVGVETGTGEPCDST